MKQTWLSNLTKFAFGIGVASCLFFVQQEAYAAGVYAFNPDVTNDGCVDTADLSAMGPNLHQAQPQAGDVDDNGKADMKDAAYIMVAMPGCLSGWTNNPPTGNHMFKVKSGGLTRSYIVHAPTGYQGQALPLVLNFHGGSGQSNGQETISKMDVSANLNGYFSVYANGTSLSTSPLDTSFFFNPGQGEQGYLKPLTGLKNIDDVAFVNALLDQVEANFHINTKKVYATGLSNGGMMAQRLGCHLADRITAIASAEGTMWEFASTCNPTRPMPVMLFSGNGDNWLPYNGGTPICTSIAEHNWKSAVSVYDTWKAKNACTSTTTTTQISSDTSCQMSTQCAGGAQVALCTVQDGGHTWPGGTIYIPPFPDPTCVIGNISSANGSQEMWDFFSQYTLP